MVYYKKLFTKICIGAQQYAQLFVVNRNEVFCKFLVLNVDCKKNPRETLNLKLVYFFYKL